MLRLKNLREEKNINQQKLAMDLHISQSSISKYEAGLAEPDIEMIIKLAKYFNGSIDYMLGVSDIKKTLSRECLSDDEVNHLLAYKNLPFLQKENVKDYIKGIYNSLTREKEVIE